MKEHRLPIIEGDSFDPTGLTFTAHFEDTSSVDVTGSVILALTR